MATAPPRKNTFVHIVVKVSPMKTNLRTIQTLIPGPNLICANFVDRVLQVLATIEITRRLIWVSRETKTKGVRLSNGGRNPKGGTKMGVAYPHLPMRMRTVRRVLISCPLRCPTRLF